MPVKELSTARGGRVWTLKCDRSFFPKPQVLIQQGVANYIG
ncbi:hypothetical protein [Coleofasciculus sp. FACHB-129]|nr:hypothetical protein [Coleofasciculus sp. FACHB-129]